MKRSHKYLVTSAAAAFALVGAAVAPAQSQVTAVTPIKHVVVIYLENHSFDNLLGFWCRNSPRRCPDGGMPSSVSLSNGAVVTPSGLPDTIPNISHTVASQVAAMNIQNGVPQMNGWQNIRGCGASTGYQCIGGYKPSQVPNLTTLARTFAMSDMTFSMADSPSWGGHLYAAMASTDGFTGDNPHTPKGGTVKPGWGCDSDRVETWVAPNGARQTEPSCIPDFKLGLANGGAFRPTPVAYHASIFDQLDSAGLSWRIYGSTAPTGTNGIGGGYGWSICPSLAECLYTSQRNNLVDNTGFFTDASAGTLPAFSIVAAGGSNQAILESCHNTFSITPCDNYIGQLVNAVEQGPDWSSTAVFIAFDDYGGFYDQVSPGVNPDGTRNGPRVPLVIVSPYAKPGYTDTTRTTFAGILAYAEQNFGLTPLGPNDKKAYPFTNAFNYSQAPLKPVPMVTRPLPASAKHIHVTKADDRDPT
jgi:phospholipase C